MNSRSDPVHVIVTAEGFDNKHGIADRQDRVKHPDRPYHVTFPDGQSGWFARDDLQPDETPPVAPSTPSPSVFDTFARTMLDIADAKQKDLTSPQTGNNKSRR
jgi:hypothetical protein